MNDQLKYRSLFESVYPLLEVKSDEKSPDIPDHKAMGCSPEPFDIIANRIHTDNP